MTQVVFKIIYFTQDLKFSFLGGSIVERTHPHGTEFKVFSHNISKTSREFPVGSPRLCGQHGFRRK